MLRGSKWENSSREKNQSCLDFGYKPKYQQFRYEKKKYFK